MAFEQFRVGSCSFCAQAACDTRVLVGLATRPSRICLECIDLGRDLIAEEMRCEVAPGEPATSIDPEQVIAQMEQMGLPAAAIDRVRENMAFASMSREEQRAVLARRAQRARIEYACSFCDSPRFEVRKLISGPHTRICDRCVEAAAATLG